MPPKPAASAKSTAPSSSEAGGSNSSEDGSSSGSGSGSDDNSSDSDDSGSSSSSSGSSSSDSDSSAASQRSKKSKRASSQSSRSSRASSTEKAPKASGKKAGKATSSQSTTQVGASTRSRSASSASESGAESPKKAGKASSKAPRGASARKVAPKKSATAKPIAKATAVKKSSLSESNSDSDFGEFSLTKFTAKAQKAKASLPSTASSSASNTPKPNATPNPSLPSAAAKAPTVAATAGSTKITSMSQYGSIFNTTTSEDSEAEVKPKKTPAKKSVPAPRSSPQKKQPIKGNMLKVRVNSKKLKPQEAKAKKAEQVVKAAKQRTRSVSASSASSTSSVSSKVSKSSSASSDDEVVFKASNKKTSVTSAAVTAAAAKKKGRTTPASATVAAKKKAAVTTKAKATAPKKTIQASTDDSDLGERNTIRPTTRQSRGGAPRRSKHVTGRGEDDSDSEMDTGALVGPGGGGGGSGGGGTNGGGGSRSPKKKTSLSGGAASNQVGIAAILPPVRRDIDGLAPIETRKCPVPGCDSSGHLGGKMDRHFLTEACPVFHNTTRKACRDMRSDLNKRAQIRKKAITAMATRSPLQSPTSEQRKHLKNIKEEREDFQEEEVPFSMDQEIMEEREPDLKPYASEWDLKLFREAQGLASEDLENSLKGLPDTKTTKYLEMGKNEMEVWYQSPYPEEFTVLPKIYLCEFCLKYMKSATVLRRHAAKCVWKHPPGDEIYRKDKLSVFEICGKRHKQYCQSLCLLAKFFLDHKTLYFDVEPFLFYVMTTADSEGCHIVGYFSKEKNSFLNYNVSCILTLPPYQRQGYGRLLIDFSYLLSRVEGKIGSPEKPLSDLGLITYRAYWKDVLLEHICHYPERELSIKNFSEEMGINSCDIISTLQYLGMIKYWKGQHVILKKEDLIDTYMAKVRNRPKGRQIYANALKWKPYEPSTKEKRHAELIKKSQEERQKKR